MKKILFGIMSLALILLLGINVLADGTAGVIPEDVLATAQKGLPAIKSTFFSDPDKWGFENKDEVEKIELGQGYLLKYVGATDSKSVGSVNELIDEKVTVQNWVFTLDINGSPKSFMMVGYENGECKVVGYGGDNEAKLFGETRKQILSSAKNGDTTISDELAVYQSQKYFLVNQKGVEYVVPLAKESSDSQTAVTSEKSLDFMSASEFNGFLKAKAENSSSGRGGASLSVPEVENEKDLRIVWIIVGASLVLIIAFLVFAFIYKKSKKAE